MSKSITKDGCCEMCGHTVAVLQKAHILAEAPKSASNILMLCPTCHLMFDSHLKPILYCALEAMGCKNLPSSWRTSIYDQGAQESARVLSLGNRKPRKEP